MKKTHTMKGGAYMLIAFGLCLGAALKLFVFDIVLVSGASMEQSLHKGELIPVYKLAYGVAKPFGAELLVRWASPKRGDVVVFIVRGAPVIKRCVALAGDALEYSSDSGHSVRVTDAAHSRALEIPLSERQYQQMKYSSAVPDGTLFAVGDNYRESVDSRDYGFVLVQRTLGKALRGASGE
ncbi:signal peptidase I [Treponema endosymbiont of Eucomonympha sp.]|uniref:signal peptidase I n=3 Tax=Treponema endosymbiont of Eucomonympha sp. TaxID=1580831 RepID=UPI000A6D4252|nr:signal peptidase I [Treponema endosymbiont of Eucomonympha sp.]